MAYLVTGGTGLIGSRIVCDIIQEGESAVVYDFSPGGSFLEQLLSEKERRQVKIVQGDVTDLPHLIRTVKENNVDKVIHMASLLVDDSRANPPLAIRINCEGTINIFETARLLGLKKVVWASSITVFGPPEKYPEEYIPNDAPHYPWGVYGACKSFNENIAAHYIEQHDVDISAIRYGPVYGAGQQRGMIASIIRELVEKPAMGKPGRIPYGDDSLSWLYVDDAARATFLASKIAKTKTRAFTISGDIRPIREVADYVRQLLPDADITLLPGSTGFGFKFDTTPLEEEIGYRPQWSMEQGIKEMLNMVRRQQGLPLI